MPGSPANLQDLVWAVGEALGSVWQWQAALQDLMSSPEVSVACLRQTLEIVQTEIAALSGVVNRALDAMDLDCQGLPYGAGLPSPAEPAAAAISDGIE